MAEREQGVEVFRVFRSDADRDMTNLRRPDWNRELKLLRPKNYDLVPLKKLGKGDHGHILLDMFIKRGRGSARVSKMFERVVCNYFFTIL